MNNNDNLPNTSQNDLSTKGGKKQKRPDKLLYKPPGSKANNNSVKKSDDSEANNSPTDIVGASGDCKQDLSWDALYDDNGDVINSDFVNELNSQLEINAITDQMARTQFDYSKYINQPEPQDNSDCGNILEIYDFSSDLKTRDLVTTLSFKYEPIF